MDSYCGADAVELVPGGPDYFNALVKLIDEAKEILHLQTYIFDGDETGKKVLDALIKAAVRGVKIFVLADAFGSGNLSDDQVEEMKKNGIQFRFFSPLFTSESIFLGRRLHHKIVVADRTTGLVGGINISNKYHGTREKLPWLDYAVLVKGTVCGYLHVLCENFYRRKNFRHVKGYACPEDSNDIKVRFRRNDWVRGRSEIFRSYIEALNNARKEVIIVASYFHPDPLLKKKIRLACARGVEVKLLLGGMSDVLFSKYGEQFMYSSFLKCGVRIYEWPESVLHGKAIIVDDEWVSVGSYNVNELSHYLCIELNTDIKSKKMNTSFRTDLEQYLTKENEVDKNEFLNEGIFSRARNFIVYWAYFLTLKIFLPRRVR